MCVRMGRRGWGLGVLEDYKLRDFIHLDPRSPPPPLASFCLSVESRSCWGGGLKVGGGGLQNTLLAAERSGSVIKTAVSGGPGVIGIVNVGELLGEAESSASLCKAHRHIGNTRFIPV